MFAQGVAGYVDDRRADGPGWGSFDVGAVRAPTIVLHGREDSIVDVAQAAHTASLVPGARLKVVAGERPPQHRDEDPRDARRSSDAGAQAVVWRSSTRTGGTFSDSFAVTTSSGIDISLT